MSKTDNTNVNNKAFTSKVLDTIEDNDLFYDVKQPRVLIGLSGGADSVALLLAMHELLLCKACKEIACVHVNHMIRGREADSDEAFSRELCNKLGVKFFRESVDIPMLAKQSGCGVEETARNERYRIFDKLSKENGFDFIATAHTASDNAETVIFNLVRGSSLDGLCGIPPRRGNIIRPLIRCTREEIEGFLANRNQAYVTDSTNLCTDYSRNLIRHEVVPKLKRINPSFENTILASCAEMHEDKEYISKEVDRVCDIQIGAKELSQLPYAIALRVIKEKYRRFSSQELSRANVKEILRVASSCDEKRKLISVANGCFTAVSNDEFFFFNKNDSQSNIDYDYFLKSGENIIQGTEYMIYVAEKPSHQFHEEITMDEQISYKLILNYSLFSDRIIGNIKVRTKQNGDSYTYGGMTRQLKRVFIDKKIPQEERSRIPIICDDNGIIFTSVTPICDLHRGEGGDLPIAIYKRINKKRSDTQKYEE